ncbi:hypothetical protein VNO78_19810 [Psophocarpus tetragonolobus]|uniref:Uncharacterized protein n=1 Tax=Psophocarpus tetragonolobus TaxID=3891 RepID=A0AAN9S9R8_PSOTE
MEPSQKRDALEVELHLWPGASRLCSDLNFLIIDSLLVVLESWCFCSSDLGNAGLFSGYQSPRGHVVVACFSLPRDVSLITRVVSSVFLLVGRGVSSPSRGLALPHRYLTWWRTEKWKKHRFQVSENSEKVDENDKKIAGNKLPSAFIFTGGRDQSSKLKTPLTIQISKEPNICVWEFTIPHTHFTFLASKSSPRMNLKRPEMMLEATYNLRLLSIPLWDDWELHPVLNAVWTQPTVLAVSGFRT